VNYTKAQAAPERPREILYAVLYVLSTGCQWCAFPKDLPPRSTVLGWFVRWRCDGVLDRLHFTPYLLRKDGEPLMKQEDLHAPSLPSLYQGVSG
jgi:hypothetical protein